MNELYVGLQVKSNEVVVDLKDSPCFTSTLRPIILHSSFSSQCRELDQ
jgi:hypothetical protein